MESILKTSRPEPMANILNGKQTVIVCKNFPKDYVGWVYLCCAKGNIKEHLIFKDGKYQVVSGKTSHYPYKNICGKVCCRFWCDKVEEINYSGFFCSYATWDLGEDAIIKKSCLKKEELKKYLGTKVGWVGYAIHVSKLKVFDRPRELSDFSIPTKIDKWTRMNDFNDYMLKGVVNKHIKPLTKAPQNFVYIESEE